MLRKQLVVGAFQCNCTILGCDKTGEAIVIDPGDEGAKIISAVQALGLSVKYLLHTHAHFDHIGATLDLKHHLGSVPCLHKSDEPLYTNLPLQGQFFGMQVGEAPPIEKFLEDGEVIQFGEKSIEVIHTPGHTPGSVCFKLNGSDPELFSGDTLFRQSIGRTDLWGGNLDTLLHSIKSRLLTLEDEVPVHPGHGPASSIGYERRHNPFLV